MFIEKKCIPKLLVAVIFLNGSAAFATPNASDFSEALSAGHAMHAELEGESRVEAYQKKFFELSIDFPILTDWVLQDGGTDAWQIVLPEKRMEIIQQLFVAHAVDQPASLDEYVRLCHQRRAERLGTAINEWAPFAFTEGETIRNSFFGYTEGLSDARAERYFKAGARITTLSFEPGSTYGDTRVLLEDPYGMMRDVDISFDQERLAFAWKKSNRLDRRKES